TILIGWEMLDPFTRWIKLPQLRGSCTQRRVQSRSTLHLQGEYLTAEAGAVRVAFQRDVRIASVAEAFPDDVRNSRPLSLRCFGGHGYFLAENNACMNPGPSCWMRSSSRWVGRPTGIAPTEAPVAVVLAYRLREAAPGRVSRT